MTKHLLAGVAAIILTAGVASAQSYPPAPPPPPYPPPPAPVAPPAPVPGSSTSTTTKVPPTPDGGYRASTTKKRLDPYGNESPERMFTGKVSAAGRKPTRKPRLTHLAGP
jgi:hypothetical protein